MSATVSPTHRVWRLGADISTDALAPGHAMKYGVETIAQHCLESLRPEFAREVRAGHILVAGPNFGIGSSREQAAAVLVHLGIVAVVAPSFSGLFFRNAFNLGLLLLTCAEATQVHEGDAVQIDLSGATPALLLADGTRLPCDAVPDFLLSMVRAGGLLNLLKQRNSKKEKHGS